MPTPLLETTDGGQQFEWSETFHAWMFRANVFLKRYWWIFILTVSGGVGWQAWVRYHTPVQWVSSATMMVNGVVPSPVPGSATQVVEEYSSFYQTQIIIMSGGQIQTAARKWMSTQHPEYNANPPPVHFEVGREPGTSIFNLTTIGPNELYTQYYLEGVMKEYIDYKKDRRKLQMQEASNRMGDIVLSYEDKVKEAQEKITEFRNEHANGAIETLTKSAAGDLAQLHTQLALLESQQRLLNGINLDDYVAGKSVEEVDQEFLDKNLLPPELTQEYLKTKQNLLVQQAERDSRQKDLKPAHPKMVAFEANIGQAQDYLAMQRRQTKTLLENMKSSLDSKVAKLKLEVDDSTKQALNYNKLQNEFEQLTANLRRATQTWEQYLGAVKILDFSKEYDQGITLSISDPASPARKMEVSVVRQIGVGALVGLVAGAALIFMLGVLDGRVMSVEDVTQRFEEPMLGIIPMQKRISGQVELLKTNDQRLMFAESCRNIRSSLLYMDRQGQRPRTIVLTSSIPNEGKSTISSNLAITLGFAASRTLLVDADLRRGQLHKRFGMDNKLGLAEHLQDGVPIEQVIRPTPFENLEFISCGQYPAQPGELLMSARFGETLKVLKQRYDFVVFDSPPILATDDAASFATRTDAVIFVVRAGYTRLRQIRASLENLHRRGVNVYGLVVNFIDHREPGYYSYKYYDYYSYKAPARTA